MDFSVHRNREGMSNWADDSPKSATDAMVRSLSGEYKPFKSIFIVVNEAAVQGCVEGMVCSRFARLMDMDMS